MFARNLTDLVGKTPIVRLRGFEERFGLEFELYGKMEAQNPLGSVKDRLALSLVEDAINKGLLSVNPEENREKVWVEPTSGNTGIGLAFLSRIFGFKMVITMPESMSEERRLLLAHLGAEVVLTPAKDGMNGAVQAANFLVEKIGAYQPGQFTNEANPMFHYRTTGPEIWKQLEGRIDVFIAAYGTGGTISGAGRFLKEMNSDLRVYTVEPEESPLIAKGVSGQHGIQGINPGFIPRTLNLNVIDEVVLVSTQEAVEASQTLAITDGLLVGISSGANAYAAVKMKEVLKGKSVVVILPDTGERYLSTHLFDKEKLKTRIFSFSEWRIKNGL
ncbi:MAG: cysteine synthase A [Actinobacteria bacterium]|nr:cysteine synthase A [Actinomycetota bacterium]